nr:hypothetical protein [Alteribacter lacisalsi]
MPELGHERVGFADDVVVKANDGKDGIGQVQHSDGGEHSFDGHGDILLF